MYVHMTELLEYALCQRALAAAPMLGQLTEEISPVQIVFIFI